MPGVQAVQLRLMIVILDNLSEVFESIDDQFIAAATPIPVISLLTATTATAVTTWKTIRAQKRKKKVFFLQ
jgi:hypothetical protein